MGSLVTLSVIAIALSVLTVWLCKLAGANRLELNNLIGIRTRAIMRNETTWQVGHSAAVLPATLTGVAVVIVSLGAIFGYDLLQDAGVKDSYIEWAPIATLLIGIIITALIANHSAKIVDEEMGDRLTA